MGFGNPFEIGKDGNREVVIQKFARWLTYGDNAVNQNATEERRQWILDHVEDLNDKVLGCWCNYPKEDCHGRVLKELAQMLVRDSEKITLAIIGTAGRKDDYSKLSAEHYEQMIRAAKK